MQNKYLNTLKFLGIDQINNVNSGHPGIVLSAAPIVYTLFTKHLNINPKDSNWFNRDRFILSAGHGSALLYSMLHLSGYNLSINDLKNFRRIGLTPGHPEYKHTEGVEITTGPLGQGIANSVGFAIAEKFLSNKFNKENNKLIDHYTYCVCGDGDLQEGVALEAISLAGKLQLNKLIVLYDSNDIQLDGPTSMSCNDNYKLIFSGYNWQYLLVDDGNNIDMINHAIEIAKKSDRPTLIEVKTIIGKDTTNENTSKVHGNPLGVNERNLLAEKLNYKNLPFEVDKETYNFYQENVYNRSLDKYQEYFKNLENYKNNYPNEYQLFLKFLENNLELNLKEYKNLVKDEKFSTRKSCGKILDKTNELIPYLIGGSADLVSSTFVKGTNGDFGKETNYLGQNIRYGVREHAMGSINNGIMAHGGLKAFSAGFFVFSDYLKPAIRLSALMSIPQTFIFSHDSVAVGEDGPTHQPIEQLAGLRVIPNLNVIRPCDFNETLGALKIAFESKTTPNVIVTSRQDLTNFKETSAKKVIKGGYILLEEDKDKPIDLIYLGAGSEVELLVQAKNKFKNKLNIRVVSMPSINLFLKQSKKYQESVLPKGSLIIAFEAGVKESWYQFTNKVIGINNFGVSTSMKEALKINGITLENLIKKTNKFLKEGN